MENKQFQCTGDCLKCLSVQRQYCASQNAYNTMRMMQDMFKMIDSLSGRVGELKEKVNAIQDNEAMVFDPSAKQMEEVVGEEEE